MGKFRRCLHLLLALPWCVQAFASASVESKRRGSHESYTQNAVCRQNNCINPLFPGLNDLPRLEKLVWQCSTTHQVRKHIDFCKEAVRYHPALPSPNKSAQLVSDLVKAQDNAAASMFFYHLSGMGYEPWEHKSPHLSSNRCVQDVWKMVCFTYFPKADAGCTVGQATPYVRPCMTCCQNYLESCSVECCDESPQCSFAHSMTTDDGTSILQKGYVDAVAPSLLCTGLGNVGFRSRTSLQALVVIGALGLLQMQ